MRIVEIEDFFHPDAGYQVNVLSKVLVEHGNEVTIVAAENMEIFPASLTGFFGIENIKERDTWYEETFNVKIVRVKARGYYSGRTLYTSKIYSVVESLHPDLLFVHGNDSLIGMSYTRLAPKLSFPVIFDSHMLSIASRNRLSSVFKKLYSKVYAPIINKQHLKVIRVQDDPYVISDLGIDAELAPYIGFGTDKGIFHPSDERKKKLRLERGIPQEDSVVLYAGKLDESKGGMLLAHAIETSFGIDSVTFVIAGNASGERAAELESTLASSENRIVRLPTYKYPQLPDLYQMADLALYPAQCSLSFYDVQASGLPVVVDDSTKVNIDRVSSGNGILFKAGSEAGLRDAIARYLAMPGNEKDAMKHRALTYIGESFSYDNVARRYEEIFNEVVRDFNPEERNQ